MSNSKEAKKKFELILDQEFDGQTAIELREINDLLLVWGKNRVIRAYNSLRSTLKSPKVYEINGQPVQNVWIPQSLKFLILCTKEGMYLRDEWNKPVEDHSNWQDAFYEPITEQLFRKYSAGHWVDMENRILAKSLFLTGSVLISLEEKKSLSAFGFLDQQLYISKNEKLIQLGKVVMNTKLKIQYYYNKKIAGLSSQSINMGKDGEVLTVFVGLNKTALVWERTGMPLVCNQKPVNNYLGRFQSKKGRFERFHNGAQEVTWHVEKGHFICYKNVPLVFDFDSYFHINKKEYILATIQEQKFYYNLSTENKFSIIDAGIEETITFISPNSLKLNSNTYWNVGSDQKRFVLCAEEHSILKLSNGVIPASIAEIFGFGKLFAAATINNSTSLFRIENLDYLYIGKTKTEVSELEYTSDQKLYNAVDNQRLPFVVDARLGWSDPAVAYSEDLKLVNVVGKPQKMGQSIWQNSNIETLGGSANRVININEKHLPLCTLPSDLMSMSESEVPSIFHSSKIVQIDFANPITIGKFKFFSANILSFKKGTFTVLINQSDGRPLQLEGSGLKNEIVTGLAKDQNAYHFGPHSLIKVNTLTEEHKPSTLLCSTATLTSTILFNESFLPPLKNAPSIKEETDWPYQLFEICGITLEKEFFAVEKVFPYRILVEGKANSESPKIIKSSNQALRHPKQISTIRKIFFNDPGYLRDVE